MFDELNILLKRASQRFICVAAGPPSANQSKCSVTIEHLVTKALDPSQLGALQVRVGNLPAVIAFYSEHGSARLYYSLQNDRAAFYIASPESWEELGWAFSSWLDGMPEEDLDELLPNWVKNKKYVVVGEIPQSGNYYLMPTSGREKGKVFEFEHDGFDFIKRGDDFADFVMQLSLVTDALLYAISSHTRYSDGKTSLQWMPEAYEYADS